MQNCKKKKKIKKIKAKQIPQQSLQDCQSNDQLLREAIWPTLAPVQETLHGPGDAPQKTTDFHPCSCCPTATPGKGREQSHISPFRPV